VVPVLVMNAVAPAVLVPAVLDKKQLKLNKKIANLTFTYEEALINNFQTIKPG